MARSIVALLVVAASCGSLVRPQSATGNVAPATPPGIARLNNGLLLRPCDKGVCFEDTAGVVLYWVANGRLHSAELLMRQQRYNAWFERSRHLLAGLPVRTIPAPPTTAAGHKAPERDWSGSALALPERIRETGRMDLDTVAIPYYRSVADLLIEAQSFANDCERRYASDRVLASFCTSTRTVWRNPARAVSLAKEAAFARLGDGQKLRFTMLQRAFVESAAYGKALEAAWGRVSERKRIAVEVDGINPDEISSADLEAWQAADLRLTGALAQVRWASRAEYD